MKLLVLTRYGREGASSRVRFLAYEPALRAAGFDVEVQPLWDPRYLADLYAGRRASARSIATRYARRALALGAAARRGVDVVWLEAELFPYLPAVAEGLLRAPLVVDYDDAVWEKYQRNPLLSRKVDAIMRRAAVVVAANEAIAARARGAGARRVEVIPTVVDTSRYVVRSAPPAPPLRLGWIGTPHTARYLELLAEPLARLGAALAVELVVIGARAALPGVRVVERPWSEHTEADELAACHVGVMPLPDAPWERGKSGYKLIQAMGCGRPVIASPVGANRVIVTPEVGWLAADATGWVDAIHAAADDARRVMMGAAARAHVAAHYSLASATPRIVEILTSAARLRAP